MFEDILLDQQKDKPKRAWTFAVSVALECLVVLALILIPLYHIEALPKESLVTLLAPPPPPPPPAAPAAPRAVMHTAPQPTDLSKLVAPREVPKQIAQVQEQPQAAAGPPPTGAVVGGVPGGVAGGVVGGELGGVIGGVLSKVPAPTPPPPQAPKRVRISGAVQAAKLISGPKPAYPSPALAARIQGTVKLEAVISKTGAIEQLHVVSGPPALTQAAVQAVKKWRYQPTYLGGEAVEVATVIDVNFTLQG